MKIEKGERIMAVVPEYASGPGWSNTPIMVLVWSGGAIHQRYLQPQEQTPVMRALFGTVAAGQQAMIAAVEAASDA